MGEVLALVDTGASVTTVKSKTILNSFKLNNSKSLVILRGIDNRVVHIIDEIPLEIHWSGTKVEIEKVAVVESAPFAVILGADWIVQSRTSCIVQEGKIVPIAFKDESGATKRKTELDVKSLNAGGEDELELTDKTGGENEPIIGDDIVEHISKNLPNRSWKSGTVSFKPSKLVCIPQDSMLFVYGKIPINYSGTVIVKNTCSRHPEKSWIIPSCLVTVTDGKLKIPVVNLSQKTLRLRRSELVAQVSLDFEFQVSVVKNGVPEPEPSAVTCVALQAKEIPKIRSEIKMGDGLSLAEEREILNLLAKHCQCSPSGVDKIGCTGDVEHTIQTGEANPVFCQPYRVSKFERDLINEKVGEMLRDGIIQPSQSPWSSPVVLVRKKSGDHRFCVDYRRLNAVTKRDVYPLPRMDDVFDCLAGAKIFSSLDLASGYWQVSVADSDRYKTAFVTPDGLFEFKRLPFGLANAPATFQRLMDRVLGRLKWKMCLVYLDDILVFGKTFGEHQERLQQVLVALEKANLTLNLRKCVFGTSRVKHLGHVISGEGICPDPEKVSALTDFPVNNVKSLRAFLGLASFYRKFIADFAAIAHPLHALLKKNARWDWGETQEKAKGTLVKRLCHTPVLAHFDDKLEVEIQTDASYLGLGAVLMQPAENGPRPVAFISRRLTDAEGRYHSNELECLALVWALKKFRCYVYGRPFQVKTDNSAVKWLFSKKELVGKFSRWVLELQEYDFHVGHIKGAENPVADALSRNPAVPLTVTGTSMTEHLSCVLKSNNYSMAEVAYLQQIDSQIRPLFTNLSTNPDSEFVLFKGVLFKRNSIDRGRKFLLVVPSTMRREILSRNHDDPTSGHFGIEKTLSRLSDRFWWPRMAKHVRNFVLSCVHCQCFKHVSRPHAGLLEPIPPPSHPFHTIGVDHLGPLKETDGGNVHVVVAIDYLTKWVEAEAVPTTATIHLARFIKNQVINRHGVPIRIISDQGSAFTSAEMDEEVRLWGVKHVLASAEHPQTNGLIERMNRSLTSALAAYLNPTHNNWDNLLPDAIAAINTAKQSTTEYSPFQLVYGRTPNHAGDNAFDWPNECPETREEFLRRVSAMRRAVRLKITCKQKKYKCYTDKRRRSVAPFKPGDTVLVRRNIKKIGLSKKFLPKFVGPFQIVRQVCPTTYLVEDLPAKRIRKRWRRFNAHVCQLKLFRLRVEEEIDDEVSENEAEDVDDSETGSSTIISGHARKTQVVPSPVLTLPPPIASITPPQQLEPSTTRHGRIRQKPRWQLDYVMEKP